MYYHFLKQRAQALEKELDPHDFCPFKANNLQSCLLPIKQTQCLGPTPSLPSSLFFFFYFTILYWFCHTSTCIRHGYTRVPHTEPPSHLPPHTIPLDHPSAPAPSFLYPALNLDWRFISYMILYMF